jgi:hypothetical protein
MACWRFNDQDGTHTISEEQIVRTYYPWWRDRMIARGFFDEISPEHCIEDWAIVHWAWRVRPEDGDWTPE